MTTSPLLITQAAVAAADLVKVYGSGDTAVRALGGVTVEFLTARFTAIMGPSGSGKSTLMHCLAGLDTPTSGSVRIGAAELSGLPDRALTRLRRNHVGFVFQSFNLLPALTAEQNIRLPLDLAGRRPEPGFADEPTGNLDSASGAEVLGFLRASVRELGQTVIMVTHDPVAASYADRVVFLTDGRVSGELSAPTPQSVLDHLKRAGE
jgi:putative ABC transport system ATP-binding protein